MKISKKRLRTTSVIQERARMLRQEMTPAEKLLWAQLRDRQLDGLKFEAVIGPSHSLCPTRSNFTKKLLRRVGQGVGVGF